MSELKHTNEIAIEILRNEYGDYDWNSWHYDREYLMLVKAQENALKQANEAKKEHEQALNKHIVSFSEAEVCELPNFDIEKICLKCGLHISEHPNIHKQTES